MSLLFILIMLIIPKQTPIKLAITILLTSILFTKPIYNNLHSSWLPLIMILTFSSGMMTLFVYVTSLSPNEKSYKTKMFPTWILFLLTFIILTQKTFTSPAKISMMTFSSNSSLFLLVIILIITMISITNYTFHPTASLSSTF